LIGKARSSPLGLELPGAETRGLDHVKKMLYTYLYFYKLQKGLCLVDIILPIW
jgi:hypothetical protein